MVRQEMFSCAVKWLSNTKFNVGKHSWMRFHQNWMYVE